MDKLKFNHIFEPNASYYIADTVFTNTKKTVAHNHDFFEFFLVREGEIVHYHNDNVSSMKQGELCLIYPDDVHYFQAKSEGAPAIITNVAFLINEFENAGKFLEYEGLKSIPEQKRRITPDNQPFSSIIANIDTIYFTIDSVPSGYNNHLFRALLVQFLVLLIKKENRTEKDIPTWLTLACGNMEKPGNYSEGIPRFVELAGKTQEHLTRSLKKYYHITPSEFVNNIRLASATKLLRTTSKPVSEIVFETGFANPSYFNRLFKAKYRISPRNYRLQNNSIVNPVFNN